MYVTLYKHFTYYHNQCNFTKELNIAMTYIYFHTDPNLNLMIRLPWFYLMMHYLYANAAATVKLFDWPLN